MEAGREFQLLEVIGTNVLAKEVVRHFSNLTAKECWESAKREMAHEEEDIDIIMEYKVSLYRFIYALDWQRDACVPRRSINKLLNKNI